MRFPPPDVAQDHTAMALKRLISGTSSESSRRRTVRCRRRPSGCRRNSLEGVL